MPTLKDAVQATPDFANLFEEKSSRKLSPRLDDRPNLKLVASLCPKLLSMLSDVFNGIQQYPGGRLAAESCQLRLGENDQMVRKLKR